MKLRGNWRKLKSFYKVNKDIILYWEGCTLAMQWLILVVILIAAVIFLTYKIIIKIRDKVEAKKIIQLSLYGKTSKVNKHLCSFCRKKVKRLSFYSDEHGMVVGVCDKCKPQAERRALMRL
ncbi:hypothetical protein SAMN05443246_2988 [Paenibacillus sp. GP183]|nr:hypothetical protein SAMN05443246_2988 [Paenibacillus sp. GP183]